MPTPLLQDHSLTWGVLSFSGPGESESAFEIEAMSGTNYGNPQPVIEVVRSLLIDGALAAVTGWENREAPIRLRVSANTGEDSAAAEAALVQQVLLSQPPPLVWIPPLDEGAPTVFDTVVARLDRDTDDGWDVKEKLHGYRYYLLTLTCLPFARAIESTIAPALPVPIDPDVPVWDDIDTCGSLTDWTLETGGVTTVVGPQTGTFGGETVILGGGQVNSPTDFIRLVRTDSIVVPDDHYLALDVELDIASGGNVKGNWTLYYDGVWHAPVAIAPGIGENSSTRLFFDNVGTIASFKLAFDFTTVPGPRTCYVMVYNVATTDTIGSNTDTTYRQQSRLVEVLGTTPTQAALRLYDATPGQLGSDVLIYTTRSDVPPNLRQWLDTSTAGVADAAAVSGSVHSLFDDTEYLIPANLLRPGSYALVARMDINVAGTLTWQARMASLGGATGLVGSDVIVSGAIDLATTTGFEVLDLAAMILPVVEVEGNTYAVQLTLSGTIDMLIDEAWLFSLDDGALTWVHDTEQLTWLEVRSPELGAARPSVWGGRNALGTGASCIDWKCESFGSHRFEPGLMQIFTVCTTSLKSQCEIEFFPRFHSHVWGGETS